MLIKIMSFIIFFLKKTITILIILLLNHPFLSKEPLYLHFFLINVKHWENKLFMQTFIYYFLLQWLVCIHMYKYTYNGPKANINLALHIWNHKKTRKQMFIVTKINQKKLTSDKSPNQHRIVSLILSCIYL